MKVKGVNHSSQKTKALIRNEFAKMIKEKGKLSKISVTELTRNIDISRGTFYAHYNSIDDIVREFEDEALEPFDDDIQSIGDIEIFINKIYLLLKNNDELYQTILKGRDPMIFMRKINRIANNKLTQFLSTRESDKALELNVSVFIDGVVNLYIKYCRDELDCSLEEINEYARKLFCLMFAEEV